MGKNDIKYSESFVYLTVLNLQISQGLRHRHFATTLLPLAWGHIDGSFLQRHFRSDEVCFSIHSLAISNDLARLGRGL